jgi:hypothetical protein
MLGIGALLKLSATSLKFSQLPIFFTELAEKSFHALATHWLAVLPRACRQGGGDERAAGEGRQGRPQGRDGSHARPPRRPLRRSWSHKYFFILLGSVADPDPNADPNPHVFGPPGSGSGSVSQRSDPDPALDPDSDPSIIKQI